MKKVCATLSLFAVVLAAPVAAQDNVDPVGVWEWEVDFQGQIVGGTFEISGDDGNWAGVGNTDMGPATITSVEVDGNVILLTLEAPGGEGEVIIEMTVEGDEFTGVGMLGYDEFVINGRRRTG